MMHFVCKIAAVAAILSLSMSGATSAQLLSEEELLAQINQRVDALAPYRKLLNDPDPARSMAAMEIMLKSEDTTLPRLAIEFGILSSDAKLQRMAAEAILHTGTPLTVALDGTDLEDKALLDKVVKAYLKGTLTPEGVAYISVPIGTYDAEKGCFLNPANTSLCQASINGDGIFITNNHLQARLGYGPNGTFNGAGSVTSFDLPLAAEIKILE